MLIILDLNVNLILQMLLYIFKTFNNYILVTF